MSSSSAAINIFKNIQTKDILNVLSQTEFSLQQQLQIQECLRSFNIDLQHLIPLRSQFIKCDKQKTGKIRAEQLVKRFNKIKL